MSECDGTREDLVRDLEVRAQWRVKRAAQHPDDVRETRSAEALEQAARDVAALPDEDPRLIRLAEFYAAASDAAIARYLDAQNRIMSKHGYESEDATTEGLLAALVEAAEKAEGEPG